MGMKSKTACLDGIKGIGACIIAFAWHYQHFGPLGGESPFYGLMPSFFDLGWLMVEVFFMLSGFGMAMGYASKIREGGISFGQYMYKRIKKLFPLMLITLIITSVLELIYMSRMGNTFIYPNFDTYHFFLNLFGLQNGILETAWSFDSPSWCISISFVCYAVFYFVNSKVKKDENLPWVYLFIGLFGCGIILSGKEMPIFNSLIGRGISCFFIGALLKEIYDRINDVKGGLLIGYISLIMIVIFYVQARVYGYPMWGNVQLAVIIGISPMMILSILLLPWLRCVFALKPLVYLGRMSLGIYLFHYPVQCFIKILDVYFNFGINYYSKKIWCIYVLAVLFIAGIYEFLLAKKVTLLVEKISGLFKKVNENKE